MNEYDLTKQDEGGIFIGGTNHVRHIECKWCELGQLNTTTNTAVGYNGRVRAYGERK